MPLSPQFKAWLVRGGKLAIVLLLIWGARKTLVDAFVQLRTENFDWSRLHAGWLGLAGAVYLLGQLPAAQFWYGLLVDLGQRPRWFTAIRANFIGHLGKYVPGKALVVILRAALVRGPNVTTGAAIAAVFYETFTSMAVGSLLAAAILLPLVEKDPRQFVERCFSAAQPVGALPGSDPRLFLLALALAGATGIPTIPTVFRWLLTKLRHVRNKGKAALIATPEDAAHHQHATQPFHVSWGLLTWGWFGIAVGWALMGLSLWATLRGTGYHELPLAAGWPLMTACAALAIVAGFVSLIPGGLFVRELVFIAIFGPLLGEGNKLLAVAAPIVLRVEWFAAEMAAAGLLYLIRPPAAYDSPA